MNIWKSAAAVSAISALLIAGGVSSASAAVKQPKCAASTVNTEFTDTVGNVLTCTTQSQTTYTTKIVLVKEFVTKTKMVTKTGRETYFVNVLGKQVAKTRTYTYQVPVSYVEAVTRKVPTQVPQTKTSYFWTVTKPFVPTVPVSTQPADVNLAGAPTGLVLGGRGAASGDGIDSFGGCLAVTPPENSGSGILRYEVGYTSDGGKTWKFVTAAPVVDYFEKGRCELQFAVTDKFSASVVVAVRAVTKEGPGPLSEAAFFIGKSL